MPRATERLEDGGRCAERTAGHGSALHEDLCTAVQASAAAEESVDEPLLALTDREVNCLLQQRGVPRKRMQDYFGERGMYGNDTTKGKKKCRTYRKQVTVRRLTRAVYYVRFSVCAFLAQKHSAFSWPQFAQAFLPGICDDSAAEWGEALQNEWRRCEPLMAEIGPLLDAVPPCDGDRQADPSGSESDAFEEENALPTIHEEADVDEGEQEDVLRDDAKVAPRVWKAFLNDPLLAMGLDRTTVLKKYEAAETSPAHTRVSLDEKIKLAMAAMLHQKKTVRSYVKIFNLYLVHFPRNPPPHLSLHSSTLLRLQLWLNAADGNLWTDGMLRVTEEASFHFIQEYKRGTTRCTGREPSICDVLQHNHLFKQRSKNTKLSHSSIDKLSNALTYFRRRQCDLLNEGRPQPLRNYGPIANLLSVSEKEETENRKGFDVDRQRFNFASTVSFESKRVEGSLAMQSDDFISLRTRAMLLARTFSVAREDEISQWTIADLWPFTYEAELPTVGPQPIRILHCQQISSKGQQDTAPPATKLLVRHRCVELCPLGALSMHMFDRYARRGEAFPDLAGDRALWYPIRVYRSSRHAHHGVSASSAYQDKRRLQRIAGCAGPSVTHEDRKSGAILARSSNVGKSDLDAIGLWSSDVCDEHYCKIHTPDVVAKVSGFASSETYFISRAVHDPYSHPAMAQFQQLFNGFWAELNDENIEAKLRDAYTTNKHKAGYNCWRSLKFIRLIFWQDAPFLRARFPTLGLWKHELFVKNEEGFEAWCRLQVSETRRFEAVTVIQPPLPSSSTGLPSPDREPTLHGECHALDLMRCDLRELSKNDAIIQRGIEKEKDANRSFMERLAEEQRRIREMITELCDKVTQVSNELKRGRAEPSDFDDGKKVSKKRREERTYMLRSLPDLSELSVRQVHALFMRGFDWAGQSYPALKELESRRVFGGDQYRHPSLTSKILRMRQITEHVQRLAAEADGLEADEALELAFQSVEKQLRPVPEKTGLSLYAFWDKIVVPSRRAYKNAISSSKQ